MIRVNVKFILILIASYAFAYIQGGTLPYRIFHGMLLAFIISLIYITVKQNSIKIKIKFDKRIYTTGEEHEFITIVKNDGILPVPYIMVNNKTLEKLNTNYKGDAIALNTDESKWIRNVVKFEHRGIYNFGDIRLSFSDLFYIFQRNKKIGLQVLIKVYPRVYEVFRFSAMGSDIFKNSVSNKSSIEDMYSTKEIRKYNQGDNLRRINWKVSAKHGELFVRNLDTVSGEESNIFLDMSRSNIMELEDGNAEEQLINLCVSIVNYMQLKNIKTKLFVNSKVQGNFEIESREDFNSLMEYFVTQKSDSECDLSKFININLNKIPRLSWIGIITTNISKELKDNMLLLKDKGYNVTLFYAADSLKDVSYNEILKRSGIQCYGLFELINGKGSRVRI